MVVIWLVSALLQMRNILSVRSFDLIAKAIKSKSSCGHQNSAMASSWKLNVHNFNDLNLLKVFLATINLLFQVLPMQDNLQQWSSNSNFYRRMYITSFKRLKYTLQLIENETVAILQKWHKLLMTILTEVWCKK